MPLLIGPLSSGSNRRYGPGLATAPPSPALRPPLLRAGHSLTVPPGALGHVAVTHVKLHVQWLIRALYYKLLNEQDMRLLLHPTPSSSRGRARETLNEPHRLSFIRDLAPEE